MDPLIKLKQPKSPNLINYIMILDCAWLKTWHGLAIILEYSLLSERKLNLMWHACQNALFTIEALEVIDKFNSDVSIVGNKRMKVGKVVVI